MAAVVLGSGALTGCSGGDSGSDDGANVASMPDDHEVARMGGAGSFALTAGGAYYVADRALFQVDAAGHAERLADAPDHAGAITATDRFVVVAATEAGQSSLTFFDRQDGYSTRVVPMKSAAVELVPAVDAEHVAVSTLDDGLFVCSGAGDARQVYSAGQTLRKLVPGASATGIFAVVNRYEDHRQIVSIDLQSGAVRAVFDIDVGSFEYTYDVETDTFFTVRSHVSLPNQSVIAVIGGNGQTLTTVETPVTTRGAMASDHDAFYMAQRPGSLTGTGPWKLFAYDKKTLVATELGGVEPQVHTMALLGGEVFYSHSKDAAQPLRVRPLKP